MWKFIKSATNETNWLRGHAKEVCFIGRSNVGKSTLINAITNQKIAKTSNTPGRTQLVNFFQDDKKILVDLPGYGYAKMNKMKQREMVAMIENYLANRVELRRVFVLVDSRLGPTKDDILMMDFLKEIERDFMVIMTKSDKPNQSLLHKSTMKIKEYTDDYLLVSSLKRKNVDKLKKIINSTF